MIPAAPEAPRARGDRLARLATAAVIAGAVAEHGMYALSEQSFPRDLNLAYRPLPILYDQLAHGLWRPAWHTALQPGGWYNLALALWLTATGPSGVAFQLAAVPWFALLLISTAGWCGSRGSASIALAATALVAQTPVLLLSARLGWVHIPEAALVVTAAWALVADPGLLRWRTPAVVGAAGALAIALRPSGLAWTALLALAGLAASGRKWAGIQSTVFPADSPGPAARSSRSRVGLVAATWALAGLIPLPVLADYAGGKLAVHARYAAALPSPARQLLDHLAWPGLLLVLVPLALALRSPREAVARAMQRVGVAPCLQLLAWVAGSAAMYAVVRCGLDNFPLLHVALAVLGALALVELHPLAPVLPLGVWLVSTGVRLHAELGPAPLLPSTRVRALLDTTCPARSAAHRCVVVSDQGLFAPRSEEPGALELFLMNEPNVVLWTVQQRQSLAVRPDALATWSCGERADALWNQRSAPGTADRAAIIQRWSMTAATTVNPWQQGEAGASSQIAGCTFTWWVANPEGGELAPASSVPSKRVGQRERRSPVAEPLPGQGGSEQPEFAESGGATQKKQPSRARQREDRLPGAQPGAERRP